MQKVKKRSNRNRVIFTSALAGVLVIAGLVLLVIHHHDTRVQAKVATHTSSQHPTNTVNYSPAPTADNNPNEVRKESSPSTTLDTAGSSNPTAATYTVQIVSANIENNNGVNSVHIGTQVNGTVSGTCSLSASRSGQSTITLGSSTVSQNVNTYDCGVFNIPTSQFPTTGTWKLTLTVSSGGVAGSGTYNIVIPSSG